MFKAQRSEATVWFFLFVLLFLFLFFFVVFKEVEDMEGRERRERRERRAQPRLDVKDGTASQKCQKAKAMVDPSPGRSRLYNCES